MASTLALVVALSGSAYAANSVRSTDIVDGQVKSSDLKDGGVRSVDLRDESVTGADIFDKSIETTDHSFGSLGRSPRIFAYVLGDGTIQAGQGVTVTRQADGFYNVTFSSDVSSCAVTVTAESGPASVAHFLRTSGTTINVQTQSLAGTIGDRVWNLVTVC
ncbi:MAG: hypothetical protein JNK12_08555 [Acidimicrobiales bacterium]|nr:hypothetical protein [Acidimicrobiales bacterium]